MRRLTVVWTLLFFLAASGCVPDDDTVGGSDTQTAEADAGPDAMGDIGGMETGTDAGDATGPDASPDASGDTADGTSDYLPLTERGPYNVGFETMKVTYQAKEDGTEDERKLRTAIWYPTETEDGPAGRYAKIIDRDEVVAGAEPVELEEMPVLIFSHGNGGIAEQNYFMTEFWASRGWAVISPEHTGNTIRQGGAINLEAAIYRPQDITAVLDRLENLDEDNPLYGKLSDNIVMSGHSFGGYTTLANSGASFAVEDLVSQCDEGNPDFDEDYCDVFSDKESRLDLFRNGFYDDRIDAAIPQAPAGNIIFQEGLEDIQMPTMLFTGGMDQTLPNSQEGDPIWEQMKGDEHRRMNLPKAGHFTFSNMCDQFADVSDMIKNDGCSDEFIESDRAYTIINTYALAFARYHLLDDQKAKEIIDGDRWPIGEMGFELSVGAD